MWVVLSAISAKAMSLKLWNFFQVTYKVSTLAHIRKGLVVASAVFLLFTLGGIVRRVDLSITSQKKKVQ